MTVPSYFIADEVLFEELRSNVASTVRPDVRLPAVPFESAFKLVGFEECDWAMSGEFWLFLQKLASHSGDSEVVFAVLDPDPVQYFKAAFGYYNWATLPMSLSSDEYWDFLDCAPDGSPADSMLVNAQVVVFTVLSKRWVVWGERELGLCVLASKDTDNLPDWHGLEWVAALHPTEEWAVFSRELARHLQSPPTPDSPPQAPRG